MGLICGVPVFDEEHECRHDGKACRDHAMMTDMMGAHNTVCSRVITRRHNVVRDELFHLIDEAGGRRGLLWEQAVDEGGSPKDPAMETKSLAMWSCGTSQKAATFSWMSRRKE